MAPTLAATIRSLRLRGGWSQRQLARRFEPQPVPRTYVSKIENGLDTPTLSTLERLARALGVTVPEILDATESPRRGEIAALMNDGFVAEVAPFVSRLSATQRSGILAQMHEMTMRQRRRSIARGPESAARTFSATA
jgi:transcriptional regulator with XRE-family HTH domain